MLRPVILDEPDKILQLGTCAWRQLSVETRDFQAVHHLQGLVNQSHRHTEQTDAEIVTLWSASVTVGVSVSQERRAQPHAKIHSTTRTPPQCKSRDFSIMSWVLGSHPWLFFLHGSLGSNPWLFYLWVLGSQSLAIFLHGPTQSPQVAKSTDSFAFKPAREVLVISGVDKHMTLDNLEVDELLLAQGQQAAGSDGSTIYEGNRG